MAIHFKYKIDEDIVNELKQDNSINELKIRIEENIKILKEQIYQLLEKSFKNKSDIAKAQDDISKAQDDIENVSSLLNKLNTDFLKFAQDVEDYKKITNERIEKLFKLIMITNEKLSTKS